MFSFGVSFLPTLGYTPSLVSLALIKAASQPPRRCYGNLATALQSFVEVGNSNSKSEVARGQLREKGLLSLSLSLPPLPLSLSHLIPHKTVLVHVHRLTNSPSGKAVIGRPTATDGATERPTTPHRRPRPRPPLPSMTTTTSTTATLNALDFWAGGRTGGGGSGRPTTRHGVKQPSVSRRRRRQPPSLPPSLSPLLFLLATP